MLAYPASGYAQMRYKNKFANHFRFHSILVTFDPHFYLEGPSNDVRFMTSHDIWLKLAVNGLVANAVKLLNSVSRDEIFRYRSPSHCNHLVLITKFLHVLVCNPENLG